MSPRSVPSLRELVLGWPSWALPGILSLLSPWLAQLMRLPLISDYYQPQLNAATSGLVSAAFLCAYALVVRESENVKRAWLLRAALVFIASFGVCLLTPVLLSQGWKIPTLIVDLINAIHVLFYIVLFCTFSVGLMIAFIITTTVQLQSKRDEKRTDKATQSTRLDNRIVVLFLASNPKDTSRLRLDEEIRSIDEALRMTSQRERVEIVQHWAVRVSDLQGYLLRYTPHVLHFSGHGSASSEIVLEDQSGNSRVVSKDALCKLLSLCKGNMRCVVLNSCYSEQQARAIAQEIDCVLGMSHVIGDQAAISFAAGFYEAIGYGEDVKVAFDLACIRLQSEWPGEQTTPNLVAVNVDPTKVVLVPKSKAA